jgi:hypothetical protein
MRVALDGRLKGGHDERLEQLFIQIPPIGTKDAVRKAAENLRPRKGGEA